MTAASTSDAIEQANWDTLRVDENELPPAARDALTRIAQDPLCLSWLTTTGDLFNTANDLGGLSAFPNGVGGRLFKGRSRIMSYTAPAGGQYVVVSLCFNGSFAGPTTYSAGPLLYVGHAAAEGTALTPLRYSAATGVNVTASPPFFTDIGGVGGAGGMTSAAVWPGPAQVCMGYRAYVQAGSSTAVAPVFETTKNASFAASVYGYGDDAIANLSYNGLDDSHVSRYYGGCTVRGFSTVRLQPYDKASANTARYLPVTRVFLPEGFTMHVEVGFSAVTQDRAAGDAPLNPWVDGRYSPNVDALEAYYNGHSTTAANTFDVWKTLALVPGAVQKAIAVYQTSRRAALAAAMPLVHTGKAVEVVGLATGRPGVAAAGGAIVTAGKASKAYGQVNVAHLIKLVTAVQTAKTKKQRAAARAKLSAYAGKVGILDLLGPSLKVPAWLLQ